MEALARERDELCIGADELANMLEIMENQVQKSTWSVALEEADFIVELKEQLTGIHQRLEILCPKIAKWGEQMEIIFPWH